MMRFNVFLGVYGARWIKPLVQHFGNAFPVQIMSGRPA